MLDEFEAGARFALEFTAVGVGYSFELSLGYAGSRETSNSQTTSKVDARTRSFALGDADDGDYFDVQVCEYTRSIFAVVISLPWLSTDLPRSCVRQLLV